MKEYNTNNDILGEDESDAKNENIYESEDDGNTLGTSDTSDSNSIMEEERGRSEETGQMSEDEYD